MLLFEFCDFSAIGTLLSHAVPGLALWVLAVLLQPDAELRAAEIDTTTDPKSIGFHVYTTIRVLLRQCHFFA